MTMKAAVTALLLATAPALFTGCNGDAGTCNEFFDAAAPLLAAVTPPPLAPSGEDAATWARAAAKQYDQIAQVAEKASERTTDSLLRSALQRESAAASNVARQLGELARATTEVNSAAVAAIQVTLTRAAISEQSATTTITDACLR